MSKSTQNLTSLRDQSDDELATALTRTRDELFRLHLGQHTNQVTSSALLQTKRRDIARILTILNGRKQGLEAQAAAKAAPDASAASTDDTTTKSKKKAK